MIFIVGAGIFGLATACELLKRGCPVTVLEASEVGSQHAASAGSHLCRTIHSDKRLSDFAAEAIQLWSEWDKGWGGGVFHNSGVLCVQTQALEGDGLFGPHYKRLQAAGAASRIGADTRLKYPKWRWDMYCDGFIAHGNGWLNSSEALHHLREDVVSFGGKIVTECCVTHLNVTDGKIVSLETSLGVRNVTTDDLVIIAAGAATRDLLVQYSPTIGGILTYNPRIAISFRTEGDGPGHLPFMVAGDEIGFYGFPAPRDGEGAFRVGAVVNGPRTSFTSVEELESHTRTHIRRLERFITQSCVDGGTPATVTRVRILWDSDTEDGMFLIGFIPELVNCMTAAGGNGQAMKYGPLLGRWIADCAQGSAVPEPFELKSHKGLSVTPKQSLRELQSIVSQWEISEGSMATTAGKQSQGI